MAVVLPRQETTLGTISRYALPFILSKLMGLLGPKTESATQKIATGIQTGTIDPRIFATPEVQTSLKALGLWDKPEMQSLISSALENVETGRGQTTMAGVPGQVGAPVALGTQGLLGTMPQLPKPFSMQEFRATQEKEQAARETELYARKKRAEMQLEQEFAIDPDKVTAIVQANPELYQDMDITVRGVGKVNVYTAIERRQDELKAREEVEKLRQGFEDKFYANSGSVSRARNAALKFFVTRGIDEDYLSSGDPLAQTLEPLFRRYFGKQTMSDKEITLYRADVNRLLDEGNRNTGRLGKRAHLTMEEINKNKVSLIDKDFKPTEAPPLHETSGNIPTPEEWTSYDWSKAKKETAGFDKRVEDKARELMAKGLFDVNTKKPATIEQARIAARKILGL
jgi:hypothetical protein